MTSVKSIRQCLNAVAIGALFALFAAFSAGGLGGHFEIADSDTVVALRDNSFSESESQSLYGSDDAPFTAVFSSRSSARVLLSRMQRAGSLEDFHGRGGSHAVGALRLQGNVPQTLVSAATRISTFPSPFAFGFPKEYYVYTLGRMLC